MVAYSLRVTYIRNRIHPLTRGAIIILIILIHFFSVAVSQTRVSEEIEQGLSLESYIRAVSIKFYPNSENQRVLAFFIRFIDFGCIACLNEFFDFSDSLQQNERRFGKRNIILMFVRDDNDEYIQSRLMKGWMKANGLNFSMYLVPNGIFDDYFVDYTTVVLINKDCSLEFVEKFPVDSRKQDAIIKQLFESK